MLMILGGLGLVALSTRKKPPMPIRIVSFPAEKERSFDFVKLRNLSSQSLVVDVSVTHPTGEKYENCKVEFLPNEVNYLPLDVEKGDIITLRHSGFSKLEAKVP
jgi:hypothetical protein